MVKKISINISFSNKTFFALIAVLSFFIISGLAIAITYSGQTANPMNMGHTTDEILFIDPENSSNTMTFDQYVISLAGTDSGSITCSSTPLIDSMSSGIAGKSSTYAQYDVPAECMASTKPTGCVLKQEVYDSKGLKFVRQYNYVQQSDGKWWSTYRTQGTYKNGNGDTVGTTIIPAYSYLYLRDDYSSAGGEVLQTKWSVYDNTANYGMKIYNCSE